MAMAAVPLGCARPQSDLPEVAADALEQRFLASAQASSADWASYTTLPKAPGVFPMGIASGDPTQDRMVCWARACADAFEGADDVDVLLVVREHDGDVVFEGALPDADGYLFVDLDGLQPGTTYEYAFIIDDGSTAMRSEVGQFRTLPDDDSLDEVVIGGHSCTNHRRPFDAVARAGDGDNDFDLYILLGDTVYADRATDLASYRAHWQRNLQRPAYQALRRRAPLLCTWDDHEVTNNFDPESIDPQRLATATQCFFEHSPMRRQDDDPNRIWRSRRFGQTVEVFLLDGRSERLPSTRTYTSAQYLGPEQLAFLKEGLQNSPCRFKLIANSVPITIMPFFVEGQDRWEGYQSARLDLLSFIEDQGIDGVMFMTGDVHLGYAGRVSTEGVGSTVIEVAVGPGGQIVNPAAASFWPPQFDHVIGEENHGVLRFRPAIDDDDTDDVVVQWIAGDGRVIAEQTYAF